MRTSLLIVALAMPAVAHAERPLDVMHPVSLAPGSVPAAVNTHILYLNRCASGCTVKSGNTDSRSGTSDIVNGTRTLTAYAEGDTEWAAVVSCVKTVMAPFNISVTDVDPGSTVDRFEVMIAGSPTDVGLSNGIGGIADYPCGSPGQCEPYIPDALVFDFANVYGSGAEGVTYTCGTAAQEIAHAWTLDHATGTSDPMTYNNYTTPLHYRDAAPCGSDCQGTTSPFGLPCTGSGLNGTHTCMGSGQATQDEIKTITALFGPSNAVAPTVAITSPASGSANQLPFKIDVTCTSNDTSTIQEVDLAVDGAPTATLTAAPYNFDAPSSLSNGSHTFSVTCDTTFQSTATASVTIVVGQKCNGDADCSMAGFVCYGGACVAGPTSTGGLGTPCTNNTMCASGQCASDGTNMYCVDPCALTGPNMCPSGFGCISAGASGVCWPGADSGGGGSGGCNTTGNSGPILLGLGFAALLITRRRR